MQQYANKNFITWCTNNFQQNLTDETATYVTSVATVQLFSEYIQLYF